MNTSQQLALRLRQAVQGCTQHLHGPVQAWAAIEKACREGKANRAAVAQFVIDACTKRINELLADGAQRDDLRLVKEDKTRTFVKNLLLGHSDATSLSTDFSEHRPMTNSQSAQAPLLAVATVINNAANPDEIVLVKQRYAECAWKLPGGYGVFGETIEQTAKSSVRKIIALTSTTLQLAGVYSNHVHDRDNKIATIVFRCTSSQASLTHNAEYHARYFPLHDLPDTAPDHHSIIEEFVEQLATSY